MSTTERISLREFARLMNVDNKLIRRAVENGGITAFVREGKNYLFDFEEAKTQFDDLGIGMNKELTETEKIQLTNLSADTASYAESKRRDAFFKSELSRMEMEEKAGSLVSKSEVYRELFNFGAEVKSKIISIPDRFTDELISTANNRNLFYNLLKKMIQTELNLLSESGKI